MLFLADHNHKVIVGWSRKCGCTNVKLLFKIYAGTFTHRADIHLDASHAFPPQAMNSGEWRKILIIRDPYQRVVSGFLERYCSPNRNFVTAMLRAMATDFRLIFKQGKKAKKKHPMLRALRYVIRDAFDAGPIVKSMTFAEFVDSLCKGEEAVNYAKDHFEPQMGGKWRADIHFDKIFDVGDIGYNLLEFLNTVFNKNLRREDIKFFSGHHTNYGSAKRFPAWKLSNRQLSKMEKYPHYGDFFYLNEELAGKVREFYRKDFEYFRANGFNYTLEGMLK